MAERYEVAVIGLGLIGAATTRALAADGVRVVGIGPVEPADFATHDGPFASHYDSGRVTRRLDPSRTWAVLASRSIAAYAELEQESGISFHRPVGTVMAELDPDRVAAITTVADALGTPYVVDGPTASGLRFPDGSTCLSEPPPAGFLDPRRMLAAQLVVAERWGASLVRAAVQGISSRSEGGYRIAVGGGPGTTSAAEVQAERVVVAAGSYSAWLPGLAALPLAVRPEAVVLARLDPGEAARLADLPSVLARVRHEVFADVYLVPPTQYPDGFTYLKLGATRRSITHLKSPAEANAWMAGGDHTADGPALRSLLEDLVPGLRADAWSTKPCLITDTPTGRPIIAALAAPMDDTVGDGLVVATGGNGYAAKSADAIGRLAAGLVRSGRWTDDELAAAEFSW